MSYLTWSQILPANTKQNHFWKMTTVPLVFFWDTLIMQLSLWQKVLASRKKRTLSFVRRGRVLIFWLVTMQENPNFRIWFANIKLKLGAYKAFFSLFPPSDCHDAGKASYRTSLLFEDLHHRFGRNLFWKALWIFTFISHSRTVKWCDRDLQGDMIHSWKYSLCRSKAAKTTLFCFKTSWFLFTLICSKTVWLSWEAAIQCSHVFWDANPRT